MKYYLTFDSTYSTWNIWSVQDDTNVLKFVAGGVPELKDAQHFVVALNAINGFSCKKGTVEPDGY